MATSIPTIVLLVVFALGTGIEILITPTLTMVSVTFSNLDYKSYCMISYNRYGSDEFWITGYFTSSSIDKVF
ncbi:MAG: hypothetical protein WC872_03575 [Candidatus Absconditabacterales bacterium]